MIDPAVRKNPPNKALHDMQEKWTFNLFTGIFEEPMAKAIVHSHHHDKNIPEIYRKIDEYH